MVLLLSSSCQVKFCENFTNEDNFNNTFSLKSFRTTAVATEFRGKGNTIFQDSKNKTGLCCINANPPCLHANLYLTQRTQRTQNFQCKLRFRWSSRWLRTTEVAKETETIGANTAPANCPSKLGGRAKRRGYTLAPSDNSVDSRCNLLTPEIYLQKKKICVFCEFCVRKKYQHPLRRFALYPASQWELRPLQRKRGIRKARK